MFVFSHGFGVKKDSRGMFDEIAEILPGESIQFDYNRIDSSANTMTVLELSEQASILKNQIDKLKDQPIHLICHSQGCLVAALAELSKIDSALLLGPATTTDSTTFMQLFEGRDHTEISRDKESKILRKDGSTTILPPNYWNSLDAIESAEDRYLELAEKTKVTMITAEADEVVGKTNFPKLQKLIAIASIPGSDHNFTGDARKQLLSAIQLWAHGK